MLRAYMFFDYFNKIKGSVIRMKKLTAISIIAVSFFWVSCVESYSPVEEVDSSPPEVMSTAPLNGDTDVATDSSVVINFTKELDTATVHSDSIATWCDGEIFEQEVKLSGDLKIVTLSSETVMNEGAECEVEIKRTVTDIFGLPLKTDGSNASYKFSFSVASAAPTVTATYPEEAQAVTTSEVEKVTVTFSEAMDADTITEKTILVSDCSGDVAYDSKTKTAKFTVTEGILPERSYKLIVTGEVADSNGITMGEDVIINFSTGEE